MRSDRNTVVIDFERSAGKAAVRPAAVRRSDRIDAGRDAGAGAEGNRRRSIRSNALAPDGSQPAARADSAATPVGCRRSGASSAATARQTQPPVPAPPEIGTSRGGERKFTGHPISLDFQGADLRAVLRTFSEISGLNIVIDPAVQGTVDVALRDVPWDQALDIILAANKLGYIIDGTIVRIAPLNVLADEQTQRRKVDEEQALAGRTAGADQALSYAKAEELAGASDEERAVAARHGAGRSADQHA